jgi:NADH:ubiquinone oxidoreductase subunit 5 (subunit L)/multisubunit Na+/H+ antiporter MnhA subunit
MVWPLRILGVLSLVGGVIGIEQILESQGQPHCTMNTLTERLFVPFIESPRAAVCGLIAVVIGFLAARALYSEAKSDPLPAKLGALSRAMANRFYFDEIYEATVIRIHDAIAAISDWIDRWIVEGFCIGLVRGGTDLTGRALRLVQTGNLQTYAFLFVLGVAVVLWFVLGK